MSALSNVGLGDQDWVINNRWSVYQQRMNSRAEDATCFTLLQLNAHKSSIDSIKLLLHSWCDVFFFSSGIPLFILRYRWRLELCVWKLTAFRFIYDGTVESFVQTVLESFNWECMASSSASWSSAMIFVSDDEKVKQLFFFMQTLWITYLLMI